MVERLNEKMIREALAEPLPNYHRRLIRVDDGVINSRRHTVDIDIGFLDKGQIDAIVGVLPGVVDWYIMPEFGNNMRFTVVMDDHLIPEKWYMRSE